MFVFIAKGIVMLPVKIVILVVTIGVVSASIWGVTKIDADFKVPKLSS